MPPQPASLFSPLLSDRASRPIFCYVVWNQEELVKADSFWEIANPWIRLVRREEYTEKMFLEHVGLQYFEYVVDDDLLLCQRDTIPLDTVPQSLLLRGSIEAARAARKALRNVPIYNNQESEEAVDFWLAYLSSEMRRAFLKRSALIVSFGDVAENLESLIALCGRNGRLFIKTLFKQRKGFAFVTSAQQGSPDDLLSPWLPVTSPQELCVVSEPVDFVANTEHRCYVIDRRLCTVSRHVDFTFEEPNGDVTEFAGRIAETVDRDAFPRSYVVDVAKSANHDWMVVEFNALGTTGRYVNNRFDRLTAALCGDEYSMTFAEYCEFQRSIDAQGGDETH